MEQVYTHMGHDPKIHKLWYRQAPKTLETIYIGKLLMMQERDKLNLMREGRSIEDISFEGM